MPRNWRAINEAHSTEGHRFQVLLAELCRKAPELPQPKIGRKPHKVADMLFAATLKVYSGFSSRRFSCDILDARERAYLNAAMPGVKVCAFLENPALTPILQQLIHESARPLSIVDVDFAVDSTGFSSSRFDRWYDEKYDGERSGHAWIKTHIMTGTKTNVIIAAEVLEQDSADCPQFAPLLNATADSFKINEVSADKAYLSNENLNLVDRLGGTAFVPFKSNSTAGEPGSVWERMFFYMQFRRDEFLQHYHKRSNVESAVAMLKTKFGDAVKSRTDVAMRNEVYCKLLSRNICCLIMEQCKLGLDPVFWSDGEAATGPDVLPMKRNA